MRWIKYHCTHMSQALVLYREQSHTNQDTKSVSTNESAGSESADQSQAEKVTPWPSLTRTHWHTYWRTFRYSPPLSCLSKSVSDSKLLSPSHSTPNQLSSWSWSCLYLEFSDAAWFGCYHKSPFRHTQNFRSQYWYFNARVEKETYLIEC